VTGEKGDEMLAEVDCTWERRAAPAARVSYCPGCAKERRAAPAARNPRAGFTLLEVLVVVLILGLLMTVVATNLLGRADEAKVTLAQTQIRQLEQALEMYRLDNGRYPSSEQGLEALVREPSGEPRPKRYPAGGYVKRDAIQDPWASPYQYRVPGQHNTHSFDLLSYGADGSEGGEGSSADIGNWDVVPN
jgi:general secretion pathway protein G